MKPKSNNSASWVHLRLAAIIIVVVIALLGGFFSITVARINGQEARLRQVETTQGRIDERLKAMQDALERIERKLP